MKNVKVEKPKREIKLCPACGERGSPHMKNVSNGHGGVYSYLYYSHHPAKGTQTWCYVGSGGSNKQ